MNRSAIISPDGLFRYQLVRSWAPHRGRIVWGLHNSSTADAEKDDPTVKRVIRFTEQYGKGEAIVVNPMAYRTMNPRRLLEVEDPVGPENGRWLADAMADADIVVVGWGNVHPKLTRFVDSLVESFVKVGLKLWCLGRTESGQPKHPLARGKHFVPYGKELEPWP